MQEVGLNPRGKLVYLRTGANGPLAQNLNQAQVLAQADRKTRFGPKSFSFLLLYCVCLFADICYLILRF